MKCPKCGNEISQDEAFCGQCGTPNIPPANLYNTVMAPQTGSSQIVQRPPSAPLANPQPAGAPQLSAQSAQFYQDATEAMSAIPANNPQSYLAGPTSYPQQSFPGPPRSSGYPRVGQYGSQMQSFQSGQAQSMPLQATKSSYPQSPTPFLGGQGYGGGIPPRITPPPEKQHNTSLVIVSVLLIVVVIVAIGLGAITLLRSHSSATVSPTAIPTSVATATVVPTPTTAPSPTISPTAVPSPSPSPAVTPTPEPDGGFAWCDQSCTNIGFMVEYPNGWQQGAPSDASAGASFTNPAAADELVTFKTWGQTADDAGTIVDKDLQAVYHIPVSSPPTATKTIGGETWAYAIANYTNPQNQTIRVKVFANVHEGKAYIIELNALNTTFETVNQQYYEVLLGKFEFL